MADENTPEVQVAPEPIETPTEQVATTPEVADAPVTATDKEEKTYAGKFKSVEDLEKSYNELQAEFTRTRQAEKYEEQAPAYVPQETDLEGYDPETVKVIQNIARQQAVDMLFAEKMTQFTDKHGDELKKDTLLDAATRREMELMRSQGKLIDPERALENAKKTLDERLNAKSQEAKEEGLEEGKNIAKTKEQLAAVGEAGKTPEVDESKLSADEWAKLHNIPRAVI